MNYTIKAPPFIEFTRHNSSSFITLYVEGTSDKDALYTKRYDVLKNTYCFFI